MTNAIVQAISKPAAAIQGSPLTPSAEVTMAIVLVLLLWLVATGKLKVFWAFATQKSYTPAGVP